MTKEVVYISAHISRVILTLKFLNVQGFLRIHEWESSPDNIDRPKYVS